MNNNLSTAISQKLINGAIAQITIAITHTFKHYTKLQMLTVLIPSLFALHSFHSPDIILQLLQSLVINTALDVVETKETALTLFNMISVFLIGTAYDEENISTSAQYVFAIQISDLYPITSVSSLVLILVLYMYLDQLKMIPRIRNTFQMVLMNMMQTFLLASLPTHAHLVCMITILYMLQPFINTSTHAMDTYNFIIINSTSTIHWDGVQYWLQAIIFTVLAITHFTDDTLQRLAQILSVRMIQMTIISFLSMFAKTDPMLVYPALILMIHIIK
jgi:hypothetical protein